jgi:hypothetical protein
MFAGIAGAAFHSQVVEQLLGMALPSWGWIRVAHDSFSSHPARAPPLAS